MDPKPGGIKITSSRNLQIYLHRILVHILWQTGNKARTYLYVGGGKKT